MPTDKYIQLLHIYETLGMGGWVFKTSRTEKIYSERGDAVTSRIH